MRTRMHAGRALAAGAALFFGVGGAFAQGMPSPGFGAPGAADAMGNLGTSVHHEENGLHGASGTGAAEVTGQRALESRKHLAEIDVQLKNAINHTKGLYNSTQLSPGPHDGMLRKESAAGIDAAIGSALEHAGHLRALPEARISDTQTLALLESDLHRARAILSQLRISLGLGVGSADRMQLSQQSAQLFGMLRSADDHFARIATELGLTRVDRITVPERPPAQPEPRFDRQPVSGHAEPLRARDRGDLDDTDDRNDSDLSQPTDDLGRPGSNY